jgi:hypothetical protein
MQVEAAAQICYAENMEILYTDKKGFSIARKLPVKKITAFPKPLPIMTTFSKDWEKVPDIFSILFAHASGNLGSRVLLKLVYYFPKTKQPSRAFFFLAEETDCHIAKAGKRVCYHIARPVLLRFFECLMKQGKSKPPITG